MSRAGTVLLIVLVLVVGLGSLAVYTVDERERVLLFRLGEITRADMEPGLYFKFPFINNVHKIDARTQMLDAEPERYLTREQKNLIVDSFVKWRVENTPLFYTSMQGRMENARVRLDQIIKDGLRAEFGKRDVQEVIAEDRGEIMEILTNQTAEIAEQFGIEVLDVRLRRIDLPSEVSQSVFERMETDREAVARQLRAEGEEAAEEIRANADRERVTIVADAFRQAEEIRGSGDQEATRVYAAAFEEDRDFYSFYRSLAAYRTSFQDEDDLLVVDPRSDFFKHFNPAAAEDYRRETVD